LEVFNIVVTYPGGRVKLSAVWFRHNICGDLTFETFKGSLNWYAGTNGLIGVDKRTLESSLVSLESIDSHSNTSELSEALLSLSFQWAKDCAVDGLR
jgi:hypothetical protein